MSTANDLVGKVGRVTGRVRSGSVGEVMVLFRGAETAFFAYPADPTVVIECGKSVLIIEYDATKHAVYVIEDELLTGPLADLAAPPV